MAAVTARAVNLYALGHHERAFVHVQSAMATRDSARYAACQLAARLAEDPHPPAGWEITGLPQLRHRRAMPVVTHLVALTRGGNYGAIHQVWGQLDSVAAGDVLATLLAMAGAAACHPEWN